MQALAHKIVEGRPLVINVARTAGFCFGVKNAVDMAIETAKSGKKVYMLGTIVHNEHVVERLNQVGIRIVDSIDEIEDDATLLIRAHGAVPHTYEKAKDRGLEIVDATCPMVTEIHVFVKELAEQGYRVVVIGDHGHQEVKGISAQIEGTMVVANPDEVDDRVPRISKRLGVVVQSTQNIANVQAIVAKLVPRAHDLHVINTICGPTKSHQKELLTMPGRNDVMVVVGSFLSANTKRLTSISLSLNPNSFQVETARDVNEEWFRGHRTVGVTAGASTPDWLIQEVVDRIKEIRV